MKFTALAILLVVASVVSDHISAHDFLSYTEIQVGLPDLVDEVASMKVVLLQSPLHAVAVHPQSNSSQVATADATLQPQHGSPTSARGEIAGVASIGTESVYAMSVMKDRLSNVEQVIFQTTRLDTLTVHFVLFFITLALAVHAALLYFEGKSQSQQLPRASGAPSTADLTSHNRRRSAIFRCNAVNWRISSIRLGSTK
jgi:hypothetical protein